MNLNKQEYIKEIRHIIFYELGDHLLTDVDDEAKQLLENGYDCEDYNEARSKGNIIRIDQTLVIWLNGICFAWNYILEKNNEIDFICRDDIIPNFDQIFDDSRIISRNANAVFYGECCRL